jgi:threonine dehydratase
MSLGWKYSQRLSPQGEQLAPQPDANNNEFDDSVVMAGNGTIGLEILEDLPDVDAVITSWGGGASHAASRLPWPHPACRVYAAEVASGAPLAAVLAAGSPVTVDYRHSFVDGIGSRTSGPGSAWALAGASQAAVWAYWR